MAWLNDQLHCMPADSSPSPSNELRDIRKAGELDAWSGIVLSDTQHMNMVNGVVSTIPESDEQDLSPPRSPTLLTMSVTSVDALSSSAVSIKSRRSGRVRSLSASAQLTPTRSKPSISAYSLFSSDAALSAPNVSSSNASSCAPIENSTQSQAQRPTYGIVQLLLSQLTEMHDRQQAAQRAEWDAFIKHRHRAMATTMQQSWKALPSHQSAASSAAALLGLPHSPGEDTTLPKGLVGVAQMGFGPNKEDWKEFARLVHGGIPLIYRAKAWSECCGALEIAEPGVFQELLVTHEDESNPTLNDIEKDVRRTSEPFGSIYLFRLFHSESSVPTNIFFGGDGIGVTKLRRILQAFSWCASRLCRATNCGNSTHFKRRNPRIGYCQVNLSFCGGNFHPDTSSIRA